MLLFALLTLGQMSWAEDIGESLLKRVPKNNVSIYAGRAYFLLPVAEAAGTESLFVLFGDEIPTDISRTEGDESSDDNSWYTLSGQRLSTRPTAKGIYIHKGKKMSIRK